MHGRIGYAETLLIQLINVLLDIINGIVKHHDYLPSDKIILSWILEQKS